jgi:predicted Zn-dependent protease
MEWNIDDRRYNQRYVGLEAYRIEDGETVPQNGLLRTYGSGARYGARQAGRPD